MARILRSLLPTLIGISLAACCSEPTRASLTQVGYQAQACAPAPAGACAPAAAPQYAAGPMLVANQGVYQLGAPVGVEYSVGANEHARAAIAVPANVAACLTDGAAKGMVVIGDTLRCVANNLWPAPQPTQRLIYAQPAQVQYMAVPCAPLQAPAAPCAPPAPRAANPCLPPPPVSLAPQG